MVLQTPAGTTSTNAVECSIQHGSRSVWTLFFSFCARFVPIDALGPVPVGGSGGAIGGVGGGVASTGTTISFIVRIKMKTRLNKYFYCYISISFMILSTVPPFCIAYSRCVG